MELAGLSLSEGGHRGNGQNLAWTLLKCLYGKAMSVRLLPRFVRGAILTQTLKSE
jgi:hypothetical protein